MCSTCRDDKLLNVVNRFEEGGDKKSRPDDFFAFGSSLVGDLAIGDFVVSCVCNGNFLLYDFLNQDDGDWRAAGDIKDGFLMLELRGVFCSEPS